MNDLEGSSHYNYWASEKTKCSWSGKCLHWHHCDKDTMDSMCSTLPHIQKVIISIGNLLADQVIHNDLSHLKTIEGINTLADFYKRNLEDFRQLINNTIQETIYEIKNDRHPSHLEEKLWETINQLKEITETKEIARHIERKLDTLGTGLINDEKELKHILFETKSEISKTKNQTSSEEVFTKLQLIEERLRKLTNSEINQLNNKIEALQLEIEDLKQNELSNLKHLVKQNQQIIDLVNTIDIGKLRNTIEEINRKIPDIQPLFKELQKMFKILISIGKTIGYEAE